MVTSIYCVKTYLSVFINKQHDFCNLLLRFLVDYRHIIQRIQKNDTYAFFLKKKKIETIKKLSVRRGKHGEIYLSIIMYYTIYYIIHNKI